LVTVFYKESSHKFSNFSVQKSQGQNIIGFINKYFNRFSTFFISLSRSIQSNNNYFHQCNECPDFLLLREQSLQLRHVSVGRSKLESVDCTMYLYFQPTCIKIDCNSKTIKKSFAKSWHAKKKSYFVAKCLTVNSTNKYIRNLHSYNVYILAPFSFS
jgi:hypothetical protein